MSKLRRRNKIVSIKDGRLQLSNDFAKKLGVPQTPALLSGKFLSQPG
jgi:hypothetical protein